MTDASDRFGCASNEKDFSIYVSSRVAHRMDQQLSRLALIGSFLLTFEDKNAEPVSQG